MNWFNVWIQKVSFCYMVHVIWTKFVKWVGCLLMIIRYQKYFCFRFLLIPQTPEELHYTFKTEMSISFSLDSYKMCFHFQNLVLWYYQYFKNVLSFSIETDLWHKARITNITFESLLSFMNWFNMHIQVCPSCMFISANTALERVKKGSSHYPILWNHQSKLKFRPSFLLRFWLKLML